MILWNRILKHLNTMIYDHEDFESINSCLSFLYSDLGLSIRQIAELCSCSNMAVRNRLLASGLSLRSRGGPHNARKIHLDDNDVDLSCSELANKYNICENTARKLKRSV